jgi:hypothetical protein
MLIADPPPRAAERPPGTSTWAGTSLQIAAERLDSLAHPDQAVTGPDPAVADRGHRASTIVDDLHRDILVAVADHHLGAGRAGVLDHVGQRLLDDPVGRQIHPRWQRRSRSVDL